MEEKPVRRVRERGIKSLMGDLRNGLVVVLVSLGLILDSIVSAIHRPFKGRRNIIIFTLLISSLMAGIFFGYRWFQTMNDDAGLSDTVTQTLDYPSESSVYTDNYKV